MYNRSEPFLNHYYYLLKELGKQEAAGINMNMNLRDATDTLKKAEDKGIRIIIINFIKDERRRNVIEWIQTEFYIKG